MSEVRPGSGVIGDDLGPLTDSERSLIFFARQIGDRDAWERLALCGRYQPLWDLGRRCRHPPPEVAEAVQASFRADDARERAVGEWRRLRGTDREAEAQAVAGRAEAEAVEAAELARAAVLGAGLRAVFTRGRVFVAQLDEADPGAATVFPLGLVAWG